MQGGRQMKTSGAYLALSAVAVFGSLLLSGCYTQFALKDDDSEAVADSQSTLIDEPPPTVIVIEPVFVPVVPPQYPPPIIGSPAPVSGNPPAPVPPRREIGNHRTGDTGSGAGDAGQRTNGSTRGRK